ncbi:hypothetical protein [Holophaga foetida]|uniref:hypothetical protein n=1 Tax=Holophaga foetida TaxID=35839 RepID=UPI0011DDFAF3|nr:hypothetical protein [Holophaga foetida]
MPGAAQVVRWRALASPARSTRFGGLTGSGSSGADADSPQVPTPGKAAPMTHPKTHMTIKNSQAQFSELDDSHVITIKGESYRLKERHKAGLIRQGVTAAP